MLAQGTTNTTYVVVSLVTFALLMVPIYVMTLKAANSYGRLEQKVDNLAAMQQQANEQHQESVRMVAAVLDKLTDKFQEHAVQDAGHFGELRGMFAGQAQTVPQSPVPKG